MILHVSPFQILCPLQFCLSSTSCAEQFPKWSPSVLQDIYAMACGTAVLRRAESCLPDNRECPSQVLWKIPWTRCSMTTLFLFTGCWSWRPSRASTLLSSFVIMFVMMLMFAMCVAGVGFIPSSLASYIERLRPLHIHGVPYSCTTDRSSYCFPG